MPPYHITFTFNMWTFEFVYFLSRDKYFYFYYYRGNILKKIIKVLLQGFIFIYSVLSSFTFAINYYQYLIYIFIFMKINIFNLYL